MSYGEMGYLALVLTGFVAFIGSVGFVSIWSRRPPKVDSTNTAVTAPSASDQSSKRAA